MSVLRISKQPWGQFGSIKQSEHYAGPAPTNSVKFNYDGTFIKSKEEAAIGVILRDSNGNLLEGKALKIPATSSRCTEAAAVREALLMVMSMQLENVIIQGDNPVAITLKCQQE
ncbi:unnamed protein product [Ilex paraguariensis]|uniref:RNase H type-1 domain-containing protein n=1 Tax=Ilex paraguariensis TaxID=185542 RepID=A0ABC8RRT1_9AQUA